MANGDGSPRLRCFRKELRNAVVEPELAFFYEQHDRRGGELLRERANLVDRRFRCRNFEFRVGETVALRLDQLAVTDDGDGQAWNVQRADLRFEVAIDFVRARARNQRRHTYRGETDYG